ncbi:MAG: CNNM domain-containing protein, partial [Armatimonadota bacterium]
MDEDPNRILLRVALILALVAANAFFAAAEMALVSVRRTRIKQLVEEKDARAEIVQKLLDKPTNFMATVQIGVTLVGFLASAFTAVGIAGIPARWLESIGVAPEAARGTAVFLVTCVIGFITLVLGEIAPKSLAIVHAEKLALVLARPVYMLAVLALPAVRVVSFVSDAVVRPFGGHVRFSAPILTEEELKMLV